MPAGQGKVSEELEDFAEQLVEDGKFDSKSEAYSAFMRYGAALKFGYSG